MLELTLRLVFSLAVVVGLLLLLAKFGSRRFRGSREALVRVVHRQHLSRGSAVSVVTVGNRVLVLGTTEHQVRVLAELEPEEIAEHLEHLDGTHLDGAHLDGDLLHIPEADVLSLVNDETADPTAPVARGSHRAAGPVETGKRVARSAPGGRRREPSIPGTSTGRLAGSVLSPDTWRQALAAATRRAS